MKKLNRKGFTLVELLAVIIILAIVVGITVPAVLTTVSKAKKEAFQTAADTAADWLDRQYQSFLIGDETISVVDSYYKNECTHDGTAKENCSSTGELIVSAGLKKTNVSKIEAKLSNGRYCVTITALEGGDYSGTDLGKTVSGGNCSSSSASGSSSSGE